MNITKFTWNTYFYLYQKKKRTFQSPHIHVSGINQPLRRLLEKDVAWHWEDAQKESFKELKKAIPTAPILKYYGEN